MSDNQFVRDFSMCFENSNFCGSMSDTFCDRVVGIKCMCFEDSNFRGMLSRALLTKKTEGKSAPGLPELR